MEFVIYYTWVCTSLCFDVDETISYYKKEVFFQHELNLDIKEDDISTAHRLPNKGVQPIKVRFSRCRPGNIVYQNRFALKYYDIMKQPRSQ